MYKNFNSAIQLVDEFACLNGKFQLIVAIEVKARKWPINFHV